MKISNMPRWKQLRVRAYALNVSGKEIAERLGYSDEYTRQLLRGDKHSTPGLNRIENLLDAIEQEVILTQNQKTEVTP